MTSGMLVVSNAGPLIALAKLNLLHLLKALYGRVHVPRSVYDEAVIEGMRAGHEDARTLYLFLAQKGWPIEEVIPEEIPADLHAAPLDRGERETLALAVALGSKLVLMNASPSARASPPTWTTPVKRSRLLAGTSRVWPKMAVPTWWAAACFSVEESLVVRIALPRMPFFCPQRGQPALPMACRVPSMSLSFV